MRKTAVIICLAVSCWTFAGAAKTEHAIYSGGSAPIPRGAKGILLLGNSDDFRFQYDSGMFPLSYARITGMEFGYKAGAAAQLSVAVSWLPKLGNKRNRLLTISYKDENGVGQAAVFEISREHSQTVIPVLESRTGKRVVMHDDEDTAGTGEKKAQNAQAPISMLVPVTITSKPLGAFVFFWGQTAGKTPVTTKLAPGTYTVKVSADGLADWTRDIVVEAGKPLSVEADLSQPAPDTVVVSR